MLFTSHFQLSTFPMLSSASIRQDPAFTALLASAFCMGFSLPLARVALVLALVLTLRDVARGRRTWRFPASAWAWVAFAVVAFVTTAAVAATNTDPLIVPRRGLGKLTKLLWFAPLPVVATLIDSRARVAQVLTAFALGTGLEAVRVLVGNTVGAWIQATLPFPDDPPATSTTPARLLAVTDSLGLTDQLRAWTSDHWRARTFNDALAKLAGMATAQRLMVGTVAALGLTLHARVAGNPRTFRRLAALTLLIAVGLLVALKRGPWIATALVAAPLLTASLGLRRMLPALLVAAACVLALPAARARLSALPSEFSLKKGGRAAMWTHVVPGCRADHPWGVGFRGLTNDAMRRYTRRVELFQNHVHSNPLQVLVELGWQGLAAYLVWMLLALRDGVRLIRRPPSGPSDALLRAIPLAMLATLVLNGFVEYNLADGELVLIYGLIMGLAAVRLLPASLPTREAEPLPNS